MIIEIEYYKEDTKICGGKTDIFELKRNIKQAEEICDLEEDNFVRVLCGLINYEVIETDEQPDFVYDRDIQMLYRPQYD